MQPTRAQRLERTASLLTPEQMVRLEKAHIMLLGLGGVGSYAAEALARAGVGRLTLVDADTVAASNLNRQLPALSSTLGLPKVDVMAARLRDAAPDLILTAVRAFYLPQSPVPIPSDCSLVVDAIDTVSAKLHLAKTCFEQGIPLISCMGVGNRLDPTRLRIGDISQTSGCPLCRVMRRELRKLGVPSLRCVYSTEPARSPTCCCKASERPVPGSLSYVPSVAGLYLAYEAVHFLTENHENSNSIG